LGAVLCGILATHIYGHQGAENWVLWVVPICRCHNINNKNLGLVQVMLVRKNSVMFSLLRFHSHWLLPWCC
jgi:hypothetical protein